MDGDGVSIDKGGANVHINGGQRRLDMVDLCLQNFYHFFFLCSSNSQTSL